VKDIQVGGGSSGFPASTGESPAGVDELVFAADDGEIGRELWKTDGTPVGTMLVKLIRAGSSSSLALSGSDEFTDFGGELFFSASQLGVGSQLWKKVAYCVQPEIPRELVIARGFRTSKDRFFRLSV
jgi:ELWxxDGT repeat protein